MSIAVGLLLMILFGASLSLSWSLFAALLQAPVSHPNASAIVIAMASVFAACGFVARRTSRWWKGGLMALAILFLNWGGWIFVSSRFRLPEAISLGVFGMGGDQLLWWLLAFLIGVAGSLVAVSFRLQPPRIGYVRPSSSMFVINTWLVGMILALGVTFGEYALNRGVWVFHSSDNSPVALAAYFKQIGQKESSSAVAARHMRALSKLDGTQFDLFLYDLKTTGIKAGVYDQDLYDGKPGDDSNRSFLGMNARRVLRPISRSSPSKAPGEVIAVFNGGFYDAPSAKGFNAKHVSSVIYDGKARYPIRRPAWTLGMTNGDASRLSLQFVRSPKELPKADYGISDVQALLVNGRPVFEGPMPAMDDLKISRTSIAWDGTSRLYVLIVRDLDSEADSIQQAATGEQTGGWTVSQLRSFWRGMNVSNAVNLSGGDSSQMLYKWQASGRNGKSVEAKRNHFIASNGFGMTLAYHKGRPVRFEVPVLPPHLMSRGSLNYIYLHR